MPDVPKITIPVALARVLEDQPHGGLTGDTGCLEHFLLSQSPETSKEIPDVPFQPIEAIVAFIDVLGTSALMRSITASNAKEIGDKIIGIKDLFACKFGILQQQIPKSKLMVISDSFVISTPKEADAFSSLIKMLAECQHDCLLNHSEILRGAVATGSIIGGVNDPNVIIGPAFIKAHELETKNAIFPRIVIDRAILSDNAICPLDAKLPLALDKDGLKYIDFTATMDVDLKGIKEKISAGSLQAGGDIKKLQKWHWLKTFLEQKTNSCLDCCINPFVSSATP
jgi:hypothetical protein